MPSVEQLVRLLLALLIRYLCLSVHHIHRVEIFDDLPDVDAVFVSVGGGGLIGGIAAYLKSVKPSVKMIGCQPSQSAVMAESVKAGKILDLPSGVTLSDGTAGGIEENAVGTELINATEQ